ncbi:MAG: nitrite reductase small subunit NirD [Actinobacteria bacterium]|nr:nitrite reductase small subunit NirD [Actinomycetota bacterium]
MTATVDAHGWVPVCDADWIRPGRGVCALVEGRAVAVFLVGDELFAIDDVDPCSGASVLSRGLVGTTEIDGSAVVYVASPLRKQRFDLRTGRCLDVAEVSVDVHPVTTVDGTIVVDPGV